MAQVGDAAPTVTDVAIISTPASDGAYRAGEKIEVSVTFSEPVAIIRPVFLPLRVGKNTKLLLYQDTRECVTLPLDRRGSCPVPEYKRTFVFSYTVLPGEVDHDGVSIPASIVTRADFDERAGVWDADGNHVEAIEHTHIPTLVGVRYLIHEKLDDQPGHRVVGDTTPPRIAKLDFTNLPPDLSSLRPRVYGLGDEIRVYVWFDELVGVTGYPYLELTVGSETRRARFAGNHVTGDMNENRYHGVQPFIYTVTDGDEDIDGVSVAANSLHLNGGKIQDYGGNDIADLTHQPLAANSNRRVSTIPPLVSGPPSIRSRPAAGGTYGLGEEIEVRVPFSKDMRASGSPYLELTVGDATRQAAYARGSGTAEWIFSYTVADGDLDADGISIAEDSLRLNGGTIRDFIGRTATLTHPALGADSDHKVDGSVPSVPPVITVGPEIISDPGGDHTYGPGDMIELSMTFSKRVAVEMKERAEVPQLWLQVGGRRRLANYNEYRGGNGMQTTLFFFYMVEPSDLDADGISVIANSLSLHGGTTIRDSNDNDAILAHPKLDAGFGHRVDGENPPGEEAARLNQEILPQVARAIVENTLSAITGRIDALAAGAGAARNLRWAGHSTLHEALASNHRAIQDGTLRFEKVLGDSSFVLPLSDDSRATGRDSLAIWGGGDYRNLSSGKKSKIKWDGNVFGASLGADVKIRPDLLTGVALSWSRSSFDYTDGSDGAAVKGAYESRMTSVNPYVRWSSSQGLALWAAAGYGWGEVEISGGSEGRQSSDADMRSVAAGLSAKLLSDDDLIAGGTTTLKVKGESSFARVDIEGNKGPINPFEADVRRVRLSFEGGHERPLAGGGSLAPSVEAGLRNDGGDGDTGSGVEVGVGLRYVNPASGLTIESRGRTLVASGDNPEEWGIGGLIRLSPGAGGRGLSFSLRPAYGDAASGISRLWEHDAAGGPSGNKGLGGRLEADLGYGRKALGGAGLLTSYGGFALAEEGSRRYRVGRRLEVGSRLSLNLEGGLGRSATGAVSHSVLLEVRLQF